MSSSQTNPIEDPLAKRAKITVNKLAYSHTFLIPTHLLSISPTLLFSYSPTLLPSNLPTHKLSFVPNNLLSYSQTVLLSNFQTLHFSYTLLHYYSQILLSQILLKFSSSPLLLSYFLLSNSTSILLSRSSQQSPYVGKRTLLPLCLKINTSMKSGEDWNKYGCQVLCFRAIVTKDPSQLGMVMTKIKKTHPHVVEIIQKV